MLPEIGFDKIRAVGGSQNLGFEQLAVQLFRLKYGREFNRVGGKGGDSGVEAFWRRERYGTVGLQAKYVTSLAGRKPQFDRSIKAALQNHPTLRSYIFVLPFDRHKKRPKDDFATWAKWVAGWQKYALEHHGRRDLLIKWCGAEEVRGMLLDLEARGLVDYYFGVLPFDPEELRAKFKAAVENLEDRYTEGINIETSAQQRIEAFFGLESFQKEYWELANILRKKTTYFLSGSPDRPSRQTVLGKTAEMRRQWRRLLPRLKESAGIPSFAEFLDDLTSLGESMDALRLAIDEQYRAASPRQRAQWVDWSRLSRLDVADEMRGALWTLVRFAKERMQWGKQRLLISGEAGTGKSHLLAQVGYELWKAGHPTVLLLGERIRTEDDPWKQAMTILGFEGSPDTWLGLLDTLAEAAQKTGVILIDAINESEYCKLWRRETQGFADRVRNYPALKLVVTCRTDFARYCLPKSLVEESDDSWAYLDHYGFDVDMVTAVEKYFAAYNVTSEMFPPIIEEFGLPLFLKIFCRTYEGRQVKACHLSLSRVLKDHKKHVAQRIAQALACDEYDVHRAVSIVCDEMVKAGSKFIPMENVRDRINSLVQAPDATKSLFNHLRSNGLVRQVGLEDENLGVTFGFERLYDFHVGERMLEEYVDMEAVSGDFEKKGRLYGILADEQRLWRNRGLVGSLSVIFPERFGVELIDLFRELPLEVWSGFCDSIRWRRAECITDRTEEILKSHRVDTIPWLVKNFLDLAAVPDKRFNADYLHSKLSAMRFDKREIEWSLWISEDTFYDRWCSLNRFVDWCSNVPSERLSKGQARLSATLLSWCFSSTHVPFRDKATAAAINVLHSHPEVVSLLLETFGQSDDPYIRERVYAVAAGVVMRCPDPVGVRGIAATVFQLFFNGGDVPPHILMRDYARCVMERAFVMGVLPQGVSPSDFRPPYRSTWPKIRTTDKDIEELARQDHAWALTSSMKLESEGNYGDFGRYEFGSAISYFSRFKHNDTYPRDDSSWRYTFDARVAKRYLFDRVRDLGWTPERLGKREKSLFADYSSRARPTVERVSKKYQWIALSEMLGYLSDHYQPLRWSHTSEERSVEVWDLLRRDFDPSVSPVTETASARYAQETLPWWCHVEDPLKGPSDESGWIFSEKVPDILPMLQPVDAENDSSCLTLCGYYEWSDYASVRQADDRAPYKHIALRVLSWIVPNAAKVRLRTELREKHLYGMGLMIPTLHGCWIGEYPWAPACQHFSAQFTGLPKGISRVKRCTLTAGSIGQSNFMAPAPQILALIGASWTGEAADFAVAGFPTDRVVVTNPALHEGNGPEACLVGRPVMTKALAKNRLSLIWVVLGEKTMLGGDAWLGSFEFTGVYWLERGRIKGGITHRIEHLPRE